MIKKIAIYFKVIRQMPARYVLFRIGYELRKRTGILKASFPTNDNIHELISLNNWRLSNKTFFEWESTKLAALSSNDMVALQNRVEKIKNAKFPFFSDQEVYVKIDDWHTNPLTGYTYNKEAHWTTLSDFDKNAGDIKYIWERARFCWLYYIIRNDAYSKADNSQFVFNSIISFINNNPINKGPHYICSQEISIRLLNWIFALHYYSNSKYLTEEVHNSIIKSIYLQTRHVYSNIQFSRIAVRNNHALTETLTLYLIALLFSQLPEADKWKIQGKKWFEKEIAYQVYKDGSYLQYSMNYHRVVVQLLTWAIVLSEKNKEHLSDIVYKRAKASIHFLEACQDPVSGWLPNYGANDGALFFPLNSSNYRNFQPQLNALKTALKLSVDESMEDAYWYGLDPMIETVQSLGTIGSFDFNIGGYYTFKDNNSLTFIRCGSHKNRPSQADNLHLDMWVDGENLMRDSGTFLYNGLETETLYFNGTKAHNTVQINNLDQMAKGPRFIWFNWTKALNTKITETEGYWEFEGSIRAFGSIIHRRKVRRSKHDLSWTVEDWVDKKHENQVLNQVWHPALSNRISMASQNINKEILSPIKSKGWYAPSYGIKEESEIITFSTHQNYLKTQITVLSS